MFKHRQIVLFLVLFLFGFLHESLAVDPNSSSWEGHYEAVDFPNAESGIPLDYDPGFPSGASSVNGGLLNLNTLGTNDLVLWGGMANSLSPTLTFADGASMEIRFRVNSYDVDGGAMLYRVSDTAGNMIYGEFSPEGGGFYTGTNGLIAPVSGMAGGGFHTLRLTMAGSVLNAYLDGNFVATGIGTIALAGDDNVILFGDGTGTNDANWDIDYIRWTDAGAFAPDGGGSSIGTVYITDMGQCLPASALSTTIEQDKWMLMPYECAGGLSGTMAFASSFISPAPITIPLNVSGWHAVNVGFWNPRFNYDDADGTIAMVKLTGDGFRPIADWGHTDSGFSSSADTTYVREVFFEYADLTGRDLVIAKPNGPKGRKLFFAYVKLVPLSPAKIAEIESDRANTSNRRVLPTLDSSSYFHFLGVNEPNDILQEVDLYRHSDAAGVIWAVASGDSVDYPTQVPGATWRGNGARASLMQRTGLNDYSLGMKHGYDAHRAISDAGQNSPAAIAASHIKDMESEIGYRMKFEAMFRLGITGRVPGDVAWDANNFVNQHPQYRQILQNGKVIHKASYAFEQVRQFMLDLIEETATNFDITGISLGFIRGLHLIACEQPVADYLLTTYGKNINTVSPTDPDLYASRAHFMTLFVSDIRTILDTVGPQKGENLELSVWVWPHNENYWMGETPLSEGLDVMDWIQTGLVDNVMCVDSDGIAIDNVYKNACELNNVNYVYSTGGTVGMGPTEITFAYDSGVNLLAAWDIDLMTYEPSFWAMAKRFGHKDEMANSTWFDPPMPWIQLISINGIDISQSMVDAVYTGMW